ncbi:MAG: hypothetical protein JJU13_16425, partial [Balneolaceae bacterium]|nr:hypothetical protein [Balneolaceae bacterium]
IHLARASSQPSALIADQKHPSLYIHTENRQKKFGFFLKRRCFLKDTMYQTEISSAVPSPVLSPVRRSWQGVKRWQTESGDMKGIVRANHLP